MKKLTQDQIKAIAKKFGRKIPNLQNELEAELTKRYTSEIPEVPEIPGVPLPGGQFRALLQMPDIEDPETGEVNERIIAVDADARPVARIRDNHVTTEFLGRNNGSWVPVIESYRANIDQVIPAVGRIELTGSDYTWAGTGWLIDDGIIVTNRHVADIFVKEKEGRAIFKTALRGGQVSSRVDFLEEEGNPKSEEHPITSILWVAPSGEADVAFFRVSRAAGGASLPRKIELADQHDPEDPIGAIGYPGRDDSIADQAKVIRIFGDDVYEKKRFAPGLTTGLKGTLLKHDCSTLGGNSGSVLLNLKTGKAVGLHRAGLIDDSANLAVPAFHLRKLLDIALRSEGVQPENHTANPPDPLEAVVQSPGTIQMKWYLPIEITVNVGAPLAGIPEQQQVTPPGPQPSGLETALAEAKRRFDSHEDVLSIRKGYRFKNGWITEEPVVVIEVRRKLDYVDLQAHGKSPFPRELMGVGIDLRTAPLPTQLEALGVDIESLVAPERPGRPAGYSEPRGYDDPSSDFYLGRIRERMSATFHVSPDKGFVNLAAFLRRVNRRLTATMYEWDPNHISDVIEEVMTPPERVLKMVTQKFGVGERGGTKRAVEDMQGRIGGKFSHVYASVRGPNRLIPSSYHIKVASRDDEEVWLSSGNWKKSNQPENPRLPDALGSNNREWHAIIENRKLATLFRKYIDYDFRQATEHPLEESEAPLLAEGEFFVPVGGPGEAQERLRAPRYRAELKITNEELDIQPLLTPDRGADGERIFMRCATEMLQRATRSIHIQNQSLSYTADNNREFDAFFEVVREKQRSIQDVRLIFRDARDFPDGLQKQQEIIERLKDLGLDVSANALRVQQKCHTKGIVIDGEEVLLGSQNFTNEGSLFNRDASLLVRSSTVAAFYDAIFEHDWNNLAHNEVDEQVGGIRRAAPGEETPAGFRRITLSELLARD